MLLNAVRLTYGTLYGFCHHRCRHHQRRSPRAPKCTRDTKKYHGIPNPNAQIARTSQSSHTLSRSQTPQHTTRKTCLKQMAQQNIKLWLHVICGRRKNLPIDETIIIIFPIVFVLLPLPRHSVRFHRFRISSFNIFLSHSFYHFTDSSIHRSVVPHHRNVRAFFFPSFRFASKNAHNFLFFFFYFCIENIIFNVPFWR